MNVGTLLTDSQTGLVWRRCAEGMTAAAGTCSGVSSTFTHEQALARASSQASTTGTAWRLPNVKELASLADKSRINPASDTTAFSATPSSYFWSSSPDVGSPNFAWYVYFYDGDVGGGWRYDTYAVRLVRAGQ